MSDVVAFFAKLAGAWQGYGVNHEGQTYEGRLIVDAPFNDSAVTIFFTATGADGAVYHREMLMLGVGEAGDVVAFSASNNMPGLVRFSATRPSTNVILLSLGSAEDFSRFREIITFRLEEDGGLVHGFAWGMPGGTVQDRSLANLSRV